MKWWNGGVRTFFFFSAFCSYSIYAFFSIRKSPSVNKYLYIYIYKYICYIYVHTHKTTRRALRSCSGSGRCKEAGGNHLMVCLLVFWAKGPSFSSSLPSGIVCHQGLELKQETRFGLKKKETGGGFFFSSLFTQYYDTNLKNKSQFLCFPSQVFTELRK